MANKQGTGQIRVTREFRDWLRSRGVSRRDLRKNPDVLQDYHREWSRSIRQGEAKKRRFPLQLGNLMNIDLNTLSNHLSRANEMISTIQGIREWMGSNKNSGSQE